MNDVRSSFQIHFIMDLLNIAQLRKERFGKYDWVRCGVGPGDTPIPCELIDISEQWCWGPQAETWILTPGEIWRDSDIDTEVLGTDMSQKSRRSGWSRKSLIRDPTLPVAQEAWENTLEFHVPQSVEKGWEEAGVQTVVEPQVSQRRQA